MPLAYPQLPWFFGFALFFLALALLLRCALIALMRGDYAVAATIGVPSQDEEVKGELEGLGIRPEQAKEKA